MSNIEDRERELFENIETIGRIYLQDDTDTQEGASSGSMSYQDLKKLSETIQTTLVQSVNLMNHKLQNIRKDIENFGREIRDQLIQTNAQVQAQ